jgi:peptide/nickel transport system permease protein
MMAYILRRLVLLVPVLLVVGIVVFALVHLTPGDPAAVILGDSATPEQVEALQDQLGLNDPLPVQFVRWFGGVVRLDSRRVDLPGRERHLRHARPRQPTILLTSTRCSSSSAVGIPAGVLAPSATTPRSIAPSPSSAILRRRRCRRSSSASC